MADDPVRKLERQIQELTAQLHKLRKQVPAKPVRNYTFATLAGPTTLLDLFGDSQRLLVIHNMGQGCRYCTLWADGFNGLVDHLESALAVVLVSKDAPQLQRQFANSRGWRFRLASHGGGDYITEQTVELGGTNVPGAVVYERQGERILRKSASAFGPGDLYCSMWHLLGLAGMDESDWTPQFRYWRQPAELDDGGNNVLT